MSEIVTATSPSSARDIYSVTRLNREARALLEGSFPLLWLEGELSNLTRHTSGHWYFSLKDPTSQVRCAMFRNRNALVPFKPTNGMQVLVRARISLYEARGDFQIIAEHMEEAGDGALRRAFEELKQRLLAEGLFDSARKKPIPQWPRRIGVITSPTGAAIHDILTTLQRRFPLLPIILYPVAVQGAGSAAQIAAMIKTADTRQECDVLILARGGGSLEDLWSFNDEAVARAIAASTTPLITGIGHEVDFTIADFVADQRAPTPTAAAELISPSQYEIDSRLQHLANQLVKIQVTQLQQRQRQVEWLKKRIPQPMRVLHDKAQRVDDLFLRQQHALKFMLQKQHHSLDRLNQHLFSSSPTQSLLRQDQRLRHLWQLLQRSVRQQLANCGQQLNHSAHALNTLSPLATLDRGYAIAQLVDTTTVIQDYRQVKKGDAVKVRLAHGQLQCHVDSSTEST